MYAQVPTPQKRLSKDAVKVRIISESIINIMVFIVQKRCFSDELIHNQLNNKGDGHDA